MTKRTTQAAPRAGIEARFEGEVLRQIRQHARASLKTEVCGVLIGREEQGATRVHAAIAGSGADQGGAHVTFTQDAWEHIYRIKDRDYPDDRIVGWYHSHPGFGVFLSDHDTFIHKNFFSASGQVAWVYDPISDEEGCFGWIGERLERLAAVTVLDAKGGEGAGETGKPEPVLMESGGETGEALEAAPQPVMDRQTSSLLNTALTVLLTLTALMTGAVGTWYLFPRIEKLYVIVDPITRQAEVFTEAEVKAMMEAQKKQMLQPSQNPQPAGVAQPAAPSPAPPASPAPAPATKGKP